MIRSQKLNDFPLFWFLSRVRCRQLTFSYLKKNVFRCTKYINIAKYKARCNPLFSNLTISRFVPFSPLLQSISLCHFPLIQHFPPTPRPPASSAFVTCQLAPGIWSKSFCAFSICQNFRFVRRSLPWQLRSSGCWFWLLLLVFACFCSLSALRLLIRRH